MEQLANKNIVQDVSDPIWFKDPKILFQKDRVSEFFPNEEMTTIEKLNAVLRLTIYLGVLMAIVCKNYLYLYIPVITAGISWTIYTVQNDGGDEESRENLYMTSKGILKTGEKKDKCVTPTIDNPFMNYNQITSERNRAPACVSYDKPKLKKKIEEDFNVNLYRDVSDLYGKRNSQREFYTTPGSVYEGGVGDQTSFAKWCYGTKPTCKEDGIECTGNYTPELYSQRPVVNR